MTQCRLVEIYQRFTGACSTLNIAAVGSSPTLLTLYQITTGYGLDDRGVGFWVPLGSRNVLFSTSSRPALGSHQPRIQWIPGALSPGVKQPGRETDQSPPASAEVKKMWIYTSTPPSVLMVYCLINYAQEQLCLYLPDYTVSNPRRQRSYLPPWGPQSCHQLISIT
jgi:hypothetical protein